MARELIKTNERTSRDYKNLLIFVECVYKSETQTAELEV